MTTIQLEKTVVNSLKDLRQYPRQSYNDLISNMIMLVSELKKRNQYDEFLHKAQQNKMAELWSSKDDEFWDTI